MCSKLSAADLVPYKSLYLTFVLCDFYVACYWPACTINLTQVEKTALRKAVGDDPDWNLVLTFVPAIDEAGYIGTHKIVLAMLTMVYVNQRYPTFTSQRKSTTKGMFPVSCQRTIGVRRPEMRSGGWLSLALWKDMRTRQLGWRTPNIYGNNHWEWHLLYDFVHQFGWWSGKNWK